MNFRWMFFSVLLIASFHARAADTTVCNRRGTVELQGKAQDLGNGDHYLFDMTYRKLTHLRVTGITTPMFQAGSKVSTLANKAKIVNIPITPDEQAMFDTTQAIYDINGSLSVTTRTSINITEPNTPSDSHLSQGIKSLAEQPAQSKTITAFDVVVNNADMQLAINKITDWHSDFFGTFATELRADLADLSTFAGKVIPVPPITITDIIIFPDNSSILVRWNYASQSL